MNFSFDTFCYHRCLYGFARIRTYGCMHTLNDDNDNTCLLNICVYVMHNIKYNNKLGMPVKFSMYV